MVPIGFNLANAVASATTAQYIHSGACFEVLKFECAPVPIAWAWFDTFWIVEGNGDVAASTCTAAIHRQSKDWKWCIGSGSDAEDDATEGGLNKYVNDKSVQDSK